MLSKKREQALRQELREVFKNMDGCELVELNNHRCTDEVFQGTIDLYSEAVERHCTEEYDLLRDADSLKASVLLALLDHDNLDAAQDADYFLIEGDGWNQTLKCIADDNAYDVLNEHGTIDAMIDDCVDVVKELTNDELIPLWTKYADDDGYRHEDIHTLWRVMARYGKSSK